MRLKLFANILFITCVWSDIVFEEPKIDLLPKKWSCAQLTFKFIPGHDVRFDDYLFTALIEYKKDENSTGHHCGGAIINNRYILTAAHCVTGDILSKYGNPFRIRLSEYDRRTDRKPDEFLDIAPFEDFDIQEIIPHFGYNISDVNRYNDIALIRFDKKPDDIDAICFAYHNEKDNGRADLQTNRFSVIGWSVTDNDDGRPEKRQGFMETISNEECSKYVNITLIGSQFCAIKRLTNQDKRYDETCYGDSGGAIIYNGFNVDYYISGIDSIRFTKCNNISAPIVYTNVTQFLPWIRDNLKP